MKRTELDTKLRMTVHTWFDLPDSKNIEGLKNDSLCLKGLFSQVRMAWKLDHFLYFQMPFKILVLFLYKYCSNA